MTLRDDVMRPLKPLRFNSPGLWLPPTRAEVQDVKKAHRKPCYICEALPKTRRLHVQFGSGRSAQSVVLCHFCGCEWIKMILREGRRAVGVLRGSIQDGKPIRLGWSPSHSRSIWVRTKLRPKPKESKS